SQILPRNLVAVLVACGYREQATHFEARKILAARLDRRAPGPPVEQTHLEELRRLSREANRSFTASASLVDELCRAPPEERGALPPWFGEIGGAKLLRQVL